MSRVAELAAGRAIDHEPAFAEYVDGRTIAILGPGILADGERELVNSHDLIYAVGTYPAHDLTPAIVFANRLAVSAIMRGGRAHTGHTWTVVKSTTHNLPRTRRARYDDRLNLNQVPIALWDLTNFSPADVSVYGADLYAGGPDMAYTSTYHPNCPPHKAYNGIISHQPTLQHDQVRQIRQTTGWFDRSPRFAAIADMDTDAYWQQLRAVWVPAVHGAAA